MDWRSPPSGGHFYHIEKEIDTMSNKYFLAVACDINGAQLEEGATGDCIDITIDESMVLWDGWDALYSIQVYLISRDLDGDEVAECVHEEFVGNKPPVMLD
jgi:hypothetical protein